MKRYYTNKPSPKATTFCKQCYTNEHVFWRHTDTTVKMLCANCGAYIKWATKAEYEGQDILNEKHKPLPLF